jgi:hypothetical protein
MILNGGQDDDHELNMLCDRLCGMIHELRFSLNPESVTKFELNDSPDLDTEINLMDIFKDINNEDENEDNCIFCCKPVAMTDSAVDCDLCHRWQHIDCQSIMDEHEYAAMQTQASESTFTWFCMRCRMKESQ